MLEGSLMEHVVSVVYAMGLRVEVKYQAWVARVQEVPL